MEKKLKLNMRKNKKRKFLYLVHGVPDLDHYLPIINILNKNKNFIHYMLYAKKKHQIVKNDLHKNIIKTLNVTEINLEDINKNFLFILILKLEYFFEKINILYINKIFNIFTDLIKKKLMSNNKFLEFLKDGQFSLIILDIQVVKKDYKNLNFFRYILNCILSNSRSLKIPSIMISHGLKIRYEDKYPAKYQNIFQPDYLALCNKYEKKYYREYIGKNTKVKILGDVRYDKNWINFLEKKSKKINKNFIKKKGKTNILYLVGNLEFVENPVALKNIDNDIYKIVQIDEDIELWIKVHPRYEKNVLPIHSRVRFFFNDTDTNLLLQNADITMSTLSGTLFQRIMKLKKVIFYCPWKQLLSKDTRTIFDNSNCVKVAKNFDDLKIAIKEIMKSPNIKKTQADKFYKQYVSANTSLNASIVSNYKKTLLNIVK